MKILISNVGSTSLKFRLFDMPEERLLCEAKVERIGSRKKAAYQYHNKEKDISVSREDICVAGYTDGISMFIVDVLDLKRGVMDDIDELSGVGYKTVLAKGYYGVHLLSDDVLRAMDDISFISPAHTQPYIEAISEFRKALPDTPMVCAFETNFHSTIPLHRRIYPIKYEWTEKYDVVRRGYHGASHRYIAEEVSRRFGGTGRLITCHLGGSSSVCAIKDGVSVDNSFGFSLQTGLPHGKRTGDIDAYIIPFLMKQGVPEDEIFFNLNNYSGLSGVSGISEDMREIGEAVKRGDKRAKLAIDMYVNAIVKYIGAFYAELGGLDHLVFTGGIGENAMYIRKLVISDIAHLGIQFDDEKNSHLHGAGCISTDASPIDVWVLPTNEEIVVARQTYDCILNEV